MSDEIDIDITVEEFEEATRAVDEEWEEVAKPIWDALVALDPNWMYRP